jgi:hypothetical protein
MAKMRLEVSRAIAEGLAARGIASLRYDKRGVGASGGDYLSASFDDETADAGAALAALRAHPDVDADRVVAIGHSSGRRSRCGWHGRRRRPLATRSWREYMTYDPIEELAIIDRPVLAITGDNDIQVDPEDVARIGRVVTGRFDGDVPADLTHLLRRHPGAPSLATYRRQFREPVDPWVVERVAAWARSHLC